MTKLKEQLAIEVTSLTDETSRLFAMADEILRDILSGDRPPRFDEITFFKSRCGWDDVDVGRQMNRMRAVLRHQAACGTLRARDAANDENVKSREILLTEGPKLDAQIAALQEQRSALDRNATRATQRCEEIDYAIVELRKSGCQENSSDTLLRSDIASAYRSKIIAIAEEFADINVLSVDIAFRKILLGQVPGEPNEEQRFLQRVDMEYPNCVKYSEHHLGRRVFVEPAWSDRKKILAKELVDMSARRDELVRHRDAARAEANELLDFYVPK